MSGHTNTGGTWTDAELRALIGGGGIASATPDQAAPLAAKLRSLGRYRKGVPLGTDTGGFSSLPGPDATIAPLAYPFKSADGAVTLERQTTGERSFDLNTDGVAHYGLFADLIAQMERVPGDKAATRSLFRSAEAYLRMWEKASRRRG